jgi:putative flippase GtrA
MRRGAEPGAMSGRGLDTFVRFLVSGAFNTAATYALYLLLLLAFPYWVSYSVAYAAGIVLAYILSRDFVFKRRLTGQRLLAFPLVYVVQYLIGLAVAAAWVDLLGLPAWLAPAAALAITVPITFLMTRAVFEPGAASPGGNVIAALGLLLPPLVVVGLLWLPFGFRLGGLIEEWDVLGLFSLRGLFFLADDDQRGEQEAQGRNDVSAR